MADVNEKCTKILNKLKLAADRKMDREIEDSRTYNKGYRQACEDFLNELKNDSPFND